MFSTLFVISVSIVIFPMIIIRFLSIVGISLSRMYILPFCGFVIFICGAGGFCMVMVLVLELVACSVSLMVSVTLYEPLLM